MNMPADSGLDRKSVLALCAALILTVLGCFSGSWALETIAVYPESTEHYAELYSASGTPTLRLTGFRGINDITKINEQSFVILEGNGRITALDLFGNYAVVDGAPQSSSVHIADSSGTILWSCSNTHYFRQPHTIAELPSGELVTSGYYVPSIPIIQPFSANVRTLPYGGHVSNFAVSSHGNIIISSPDAKT